MKMSHASLYSDTLYGYHYGWPLDTVYATFIKSWWVTRCDTWESLQLNNYVELSGKVNNRNYRIIFYA